MKCTKCKEDINTVCIKSACWQDADINEQGEITFYNGVEEVGETIKIICSKCGATITKHINA